jgi:hypothetical protein
MRVYLPGDVATVRALVGAGSVPVPVAHAVTAALRAEEPAADEEELEYRALLAAADDSAALVAGAASGAPGAGLRVVVAADVPDATVLGPVAGSVTAVRLAAAVPRADVAAAHVDETAAVPVEERDLLWYAPQELADWLAGLG